MKTKNRLPSPAELASFISDIGIEEFCAGDPIEGDPEKGGVMYQAGFRGSRFFSRALEVWTHWERAISEGAVEWADSLARGARNMERIPISQCMRELQVRDRRTIEGLFLSSAREFWPMAASIRGPKEWERATTEGIERRMVDRMAEERDRRASERASKGAKAKAEKHGKKFKQES